MDKNGYTELGAPKRMAPHGLSACPLSWRWFIHVRVAQGLGHGDEKAGHKQTVLCSLYPSPTPEKSGPSWATAKPGLEPARVVLCVPLLRIESRRVKYTTQRNSGEKWVLQRHTHPFFFETIALNHCTLNDSVYCKMTIYCICSYVTSFSILSLFFFCLSSCLGHFRALVWINE